MVGRRDAPRAPDRVEMAALHAGVRPGSARTGGTACISRVVALQDHLGVIHDAEVAAPHGPHLPRRDSGVLPRRPGRGDRRYLAVREREVARFHRTVGVPWRGIAGLTFRRALGRTLAAL